MTKVQEEPEPHGAPLEPTQSAVPPGAREGGWNARVWRLAGPIILSNISTPLLGAVDTAVVGHLPDPAYIGGVALGAVIFSFLYWGFGFLRMGTTGFTTQAHGAGDREELTACLLRPLMLGVALGAAVIALQVPAAWFAFSMMEGSQQVEALAGDYFDIRIWSAPAALVNYTVLGWLLGTQRATLALLLQVALNGINIALDLLFVIGFGWGIEGVAAASLIAEVTAAAIGLVIVARILKREGRRPAATMVFARDKLIALFRANFDIFLRTVSLLFAFAYFTSQGAAVSDVALAANAILLQLQFFMGHALDGFAHAAEVLAGSAWGAKSPRAFRQAVRTSTAWAFAGAFLASAIYLAFGPLIISLFTSIAEVQAAAEVYLIYLVLSPPLSVLSFQFDGIFIGTTRTAEMRNAMIVSLVIYLVACWTLIPWLGNHGLWIAFLTFMVARAVTLGAYWPRLTRIIAAAT